MHKNIGDKILGAMMNKYGVPLYVSRHGYEGSQDESPKI